MIDSPSRGDRVTELEIELLAASEADLRARVVEIETDSAVYRELAIAGLDALRSVTLQLARLAAEHQRLRDEYRDLREQVMIDAGADEDESAAA